jgi:hypothetical protein
MGLFSALFAMRLNASPLGIRGDPQIVSVFIFFSSAGDEIPGMRAGARSRLRILALISVVNDVFSLSFTSGCFVMIRVDIVLFAHKFSIGQIG